MSPSDATPPPLVLTFLWDTQLPTVPCVQNMAKPTRLVRWNEQLTPFNLVTPSVSEQSLQPNPLRRAFRVATAAMQVLPKTRPLPSIFIEVSMSRWPLPGSA